MHHKTITNTYWLIFVFLVGCNQQNNITLTGHIDYLGSAEMFVAKQPVHYKYAPKKRFSLTPGKNGQFGQTIPVDSTQIIDLYIGDTSYPIVVQPGQDLEIQIYRAKFPDSVQVKGYPSPWDRLYNRYFDQQQALLKQADMQLPAFRNGDSTNVLSLYQKRYRLAHDIFQRTPLVDLYHKAVGEYLVKRLEALKYQRNQPEIKPEQVRQDIINEASKLNFFSFESLHAQRAGIRDFTNAYANTFGVADSLQKKYGQELTQYDIKRLGYQRLNAARTSVLKHIPGRRARAYAQMHLIAERIGEMPLKIATPTYKQYLKKYADFSKYTSFLKSFYQQIERVSPGNPAIPFSLPNKNGNLVQMKDFRGKFVLLDFWASWCIPCLDAFPHMKDLYKKYSRDTFEIVAISIEEDSLRWRQTMQRFNNPWPQLYGGNGFQQETFRAYRGGGIPFYILVGPEGTIRRYNDIRPSFNLPEVLDSLITEYQ